MQKDHPVSITRQIIESVFPPSIHRYRADAGPVVSTFMNFDFLGFPEDHPGRARTDTYYLNRDTLLRTHTSAHERELFRASLGDGYLFSADVYRRDDIDRSHYSIFHQTEGVRKWDRALVPGGDVAAAVYADLEKLPSANVTVEDATPPFDEQRNPPQAEHHSAAEAEAIVAHLKRSLELVVVEIFGRARAAAQRADPDFVDKPLQVRWVEAYFPFTSPSWELEVYYGGDWLEVLGCGVTKQDLYVNAGRPSQLGWAFGIGLDRIAMLLFQIPDIRLFWSLDPRFLGQFAGVSDDLRRLRPFVPFSRYPARPLDLSFWLKPTSAAGGSVKANTHDFHDQDVMDIVRSVAGDVVEDVKLVDQYTDPRTGRQSRCYRINYNSLERMLEKSETTALHGEVSRKLVEKLGVEMR